MIPNQYTCYLQTLIKADLTNQLLVISIETPAHIILITRSTIH